MFFLGLVIGIPAGALAGILAFDHFTRRPNPDPEGTKVFGSEHPNAHERRP